MDDEFRNFVLAWLERRGWSQGQLSDATGISQSLVSKHLSANDRRRVTPLPVNLERYAPTLGVPYLELLRMCGYVPGEPSDALEIPEEIEADVRARTAELLAAVHGAPQPFWVPIIKASFDRIVDVARDMVTIAQSAEDDWSAHKSPKLAPNKASTRRSIRRSSGRHDRINPRFQTLALA